MNIPSDRLTWRARLVLLVGILVVFGYAHAIGDPASDPPGDAADDAADDAASNAASDAAIDAAGTTPSQNTAPRQSAGRNTPPRQETRLRPETVPPVLSACEFDYPPFSVVTVQGEADGFSVELLRVALEAMGREVIFRTGTWPQIRSWLETEQVEVLPLVGRAPEREALFDFTVPYMSLHGAIVVRKGTQGIRHIDDLTGKQVAVMKGDGAEEFLRKKKPDIRLHATDSYATALRELSAGQHDAVVMQRLVAVRLIQDLQLAGLEIIGQSVDGFVQEFCFAVPEGHSRMLALLNEGLALVIADGTHRRLHSKWFANFQLPSNRPLVIGGDYKFPPYEYLDDQGQPAGFNVDLTRAIGRQMGIDIEVRLGPWPEIMDQLQSGQIDAIQGMIYSAERDHSYDFTAPHLVPQYVAVTRSEDPPPPSTLAGLEGKRIIVQAGDIMHGFLRQNDARAETVSAVDSQEEALRMLALGHCDCVLAARITALYWINRHGWDHLVVGHKPFLTSEYCFAVREGHSALLSTLAEGLKVLGDTGEYRRIYDHWMGVYEAPESKVAAALRYLALGTIPLLLLLLASYIWSRSLRTQVAQRTEALRRSKETYRLLADNTLDVIWTMNLDLVFTYVNPACRYLSGFEPEEWIGAHLKDHCDEDEFRMMTAIIEQEIDKGPASTGVIFESAMRTKQGDPMPVEIHGRIVYDAGGHPVALQGVTRDIADRKRAEAERQKLSEQLEHAQRMESVGRLAGGVAHDYNNMLSVIIGYSELALDKVAPDGPLQGDLREILTAAKRSADITRQLLAFARRQPIAPRAIDLNTTVENMLKMLRRLIGEDIELTWRPGDELQSVTLDPSQVDQILANLCVNARDAIPGMGQITIETRNVPLEQIEPGAMDLREVDLGAMNPGRVDPDRVDVAPRDVEQAGPAESDRARASCAGFDEEHPRSFVMLSVADDGVGMSSSTKEKVFEPFFTTKDLGKGTGLGLATVYGIVRQNRGFIHIDSEPGLGTTVKVYLPRAGEHQELQSVDREDSSSAGQGQRILLVEDELAILKLDYRILAEAGYEVTPASSAREAIELAERQLEHLDLLITDVIMPDMNGHDLAKVVAVLHPCAKILYVSGYAADAIANHGILEPGVALLRKPFSKRELTTEVRSILDGEPESRLAS